MTDTKATSTASPELDLDDVPAALEAFRERHGMNTFMERVCMIRTSDPENPTLPRLAIVSDLFPGLCVVPLGSDCSVTHIGSGYALSRGDELIPSLNMAIRAARMTDWTVATDDVGRSVSKSDRRIMRDYGKLLDLQQNEEESDGL